MGTRGAGEQTENTPIFAFFCYGEAFYWFFTNKFVILKTGCKEYPPMKNMCRAFTFAAVALTAVASLSLVACDDDSSSAKDEMPSSSSTQELSEETCDEDGSVEECLAECSAKNEGQVKVLWVGNPKYGGYEYYRCEGGSWVKGNITLTCDTVGAPIGAFCRRSPSVNLFGAGMGVGEATNTYIYAGAGVWETLTGPIKLDEECVKENIGKKKISSYGDKRENTYYLECAEDGWQFVNEFEYHCDVKNAVSGDVCSFSVNGESAHYIYYPMFPEAGDSVAMHGWFECNYDSAMGCCPKEKFPLGYSPVLGFHELDGKSYYCNAGEWISTAIVPRQYTDSRAEGMSFMEYDVLDLPKEASVGDRAAGLLEYCIYGAVLDDEEGPKQGTFNYCVPHTYYRYREDGSWTMETIDEANEDQIYVGDTPCGPTTWCCAETEGLKSVSHMGGYEPDRIYQCVSGEIEFVDYELGRYEEVKSK